MSSPHAGDLTELLLERLARRIVELQQELAPPPETDGERSPWMNIETAAAYLDWPKQRLYKLTGGCPTFCVSGQSVSEVDFE